MLSPSEVKRLRKTGILAMIAIAVFILILINSSPVKLAFKAIEQNDYIKAGEIYENRIAGKSKKEAAFMQKLESELERLHTDLELDDEGILLILEGVAGILPGDPDIDRLIALYTPLDEEQKDIEAYVLAINQPVTIRIVSQFGGTDTVAGVYANKIEEFRAENPHITVEDESATADEAWKTKVATDFVAGNEPDVIFTFTGIDAKTMIEEEKVVSLADIRAEFPDYASHISEGVLNSMREFDGNTYAVPVRGFYEGLFINQRLFREYGLELPTDWAKLETAIEVLSANGIVPVAAALGHLPHYWIEHLILSQGGVEVHKNRDIAAVRNQWIAGLSQFKSLYEMSAFPKDTNAISNDVATDLFNKGRAGMLLDGNWVIGGFGGSDDSAKDDYTVIPMPVVPGGVADPSDIIGGFSTGWYITTKGWNDPRLSLEERLAKRQAVVKYVSKMIAMDTMGEIVEQGGTPSADLGFVTGLPSPENDGFKMQAAARNMDMPIDSWLAKTAWDKLLSLIPSIATGERGPAEVVDEVIELSR